MFFLQQKYKISKILPCRDKIHLLWDLSLLKSKILGTLYKIFAKIHVFFNKILKKAYAIEKGDMCKEESLYIRCLYLSDARIWRTWGLWGFQQVFDFKYWAKSKAWKPRKWTFFLLKPHCKVKVLSFRSCFWFLVLCTTKNLIKIKLSEISESSILGIGQNRKLGNLGNWIFFLIKPHPNVIVSFFPGIL